MASRRAFAALAIWLGIVAGIPAAAETLSYTHQGVERSAELFRPEGFGDGPRPLVIALHGLNQDIEGLRRWLPLHIIAERERFAVVYPVARELKWSYGRPIVAPMPAIGDEPVDDTGFIRRVIDDLTARRIADPARVYVTGPSRGGLMAFTVACALADRVAAAAPLITGMTDHQRDDCDPSRPVPIMVIAGTRDPSQPFPGQQLALGRLLSVPDTMDFWRRLHGCGGRDVQTLPHRDPTDPTRTTLVQWRDCRSGAPPRLYRIEGGGHQIPSFEPPNPDSGQRFGLRGRDIDAAAEIWAFFAAVPPLPQRGISTQ